MRHISNIVDIEARAPGYWGDLDMVEKQSLGSCKKHSKEEGAHFGGRFDDVYRGLKCLAWRFYEGAHKAESTTEWT